MSKTTTRLLAVSALALAAGFFGTTQLQAGQALPGDIIVAQGAGGSGGSGGGSGGGGDSGREYNDQSHSTNPSGRVPPPADNLGSAPASPSNPNLSGTPAPQSGVPAQCQSITRDIDRQACINRVK